MFDKIAGMGRGAVFVLCLSVVWFNPINALILLSVGSQAASIDVPTPHLAAFARRVHAAGHSPVRRRGGVLESGGERVSAALERFRQWLVDHYRIIMAAILGLLGLVFLAQGVASLPG